MKQIHLDLSPQKRLPFYKNNETALEQIRCAWRGNVSLILYSESSGAVGKHYLIAEDTYAALIPAKRYVISAACHKSSYNLCYLTFPFDPIRSDPRDQLVLFESLERVSDTIPFPFSNVQVTNGLAMKAEIDSMRIQTAIKGSWAKELYADSGPNSDPYGLALEMIAAIEAGLPFCGDGVPERACENLAEAFYVVASLKYPEWERERVKWNARVDDLEKFGVSPEISGDHLRYLLTNADIHIPRRRTR